MTEIIEKTDNLEKQELSEKEWQEVKAEEYKKISQKITSLEKKQQELAETPGIDQRKIWKISREINYYKARLEAFDYKLNNLSEVEYKSNLRVRFIYERHGRAQNPDVVRGVDKLFVEGIGDSKDEKINKDRDNNIIFACQKSNIPVYWVDINGQFGKSAFKDRKDSEKKETDIQIAISIAGLILAGTIGYYQHIVKKSANKNNISRRKFLSILTIAGSTCISFPWWPLYRNIEKKKSGQLAGNIIEKIHAKIIKQFGLKKIVIVLRNMIWAEKISHIHSLEMKTGKTKDYFGINCGAAHTGLEPALALDSDTRIKIIKKIIEEEKINIQDPEWEIALTTKNVYNEQENKWGREDIVIPSLMSIFEK